MELGGLEPKQLQADLKVDKGQFSRWQSGEEGIKWPKLEALQQRCGNSAPALWMFYQSGFDLESVRRLETEITHPIFGYKVSYRRILEVQARLLSRVLLGDLAEYPNFCTR